jgi:hypothetical protein
MMKSKMKIMAVAAFALAAGSLLTGCLDSEGYWRWEKHPAAPTPLTAAQEAAQNKEVQARLRAYYANTTPAQRAAEARQAALNQIAWAQQQMVSNQQQMIANQEKAQQQQQMHQQLQELEESNQRIYDEGQRPQFYQGTVDENGNVTMYGY